MPALEPTSAVATKVAQAELQRFPDVTREHILHCSYDYWFPKYRRSCIRSRIIPLTPEFIAYLREDGILLADDEPDTAQGDDDDDWEPAASSRDVPPPDIPHPNQEQSDSEDDDGENSAPPRLPPNQRFPEMHQAIKDAIVAVGGAAAPKLNWSSPKDATWISRHPNTMKCTSPNDIYLLMKSSLFVSHDLERAFADTVPPTTHPSPASPTAFTPVLVLRAFFNPLPSLEFRCFVKDRTLVAISQRDLNHYAFLSGLRAAITIRVKELFATLRFSFPEANFVFDVYIPETDFDDEVNQLGRARLIDINPWAPRTDTLLFGWSELLSLRVPQPMLGTAVEGDLAEQEEEEEEYEPELRIVEKDDPAAYNFTSAQYSAHKMPKEVVDASMAGEGGLRAFAEQWQRVIERRQ
ncbi:D123-domain-containing protein [Thozetella sp. PMI_491]|nr:D123-domain-containing protein [Thozetella sp. PMI_491]